ncbi:MAG: DPP IV N-terminal domain-containing protein [Planctomycetota bacterium]
MTLGSLLTVVGLAVGCRSTADQRARVDRPQRNTSAVTVASQNAPGPSAQQNNAAPPSDEAVWLETVSQSSPTSDTAASSSNEPGHTVGSTRPDPYNIWGDLSGRARPSLTQSGETFDPFDMSRITFSEEGADFDPRLTPNGTHVYFASTRHRDTADIYIKSVRGRAVRQLTTDPANDVMPSISPDGTQLAFASDRAGSWDIYITDVNGGQARPITTSTTQELHPTFSPDGTRLAYCRLGETSGRWELWVTEVDNPQVAFHVGYGLFPEWCPVTGTGAAGGDRVLFQRARERGGRLFSIWTLEIRPDNEAGFLTELASEPASALINPTWSDDGQRLAFVRASIDDSSAERPSNGDIVMMNIDGSGLTNLTADDSVNLMPAWGMGDSVFFVSDREATNSIWSVNVREAVIAAGEPLPESLPITARTEAPASPTRTASGTTNNPTRDGSKRPAGGPVQGLTNFTEQP